MGLLDSMLGGGTDLALALDRPKGSPGGVVGGKIRLVGGKKPLKLTKLKVHLIYVSVKSKPDSALPEIDMRVVNEQVVAAGIDLPPGSVHEHTFRMTLPSDTLPSAHNVSYKIQAVADIPGVKDPSAEKDLEVVPAEKNADFALPLEQVLAEYPNLRSQNEEQLCEALRQLFLDCYSKGGTLMEAEPLLAQHMKTGTVNVRRAALQAWANLVDNRVKPQHLESLYAVANMPGLDQQTFDEVIRAACKFAEEGAIHMVQQLAESPDPHVRAQVAQGLRFDAANRFQGKREILVHMIQDPDPKVRAAVVGAFSDFADDAQIMHGVAQMCDNDPAPEVQVACINTLATIHRGNDGQLTRAVYEKHLNNPNADVRQAIAQNLSWQPKEQLQWVWNVAQRLAQDQSEDVRRSMAFQFVNMERFPQLLPIAKHMAENDPSEDVRVDALQGMGRLAPVNDLVPYYQSKLAADASKRMLWAIISGLRYHNKAKPAQALLTQLGQHPDPSIADSARDALT
jgi:HEAT repeat protein